MGQRERYEDWLGMGRGLVRRGLWAPTLVVADGAPGLIRAIEERRDATRLSEGERLTTQVSRKHGPGSR